MKKYSINIFFCILCVWITGCSSVVNSHLQKMDMMEAMVGGDNSTAESELQSFLKPPAWYNSSVVNTGDELHWRLEAGSFYFHTGEYQKVINELGTAEKLITEYDERAKISLRDIGAESAVLVTNLNALPYRGLCRDRIMLSFFKSLAYLGVEKEDSFRAQLRRLRSAQKQVQEDYKSFFEEEQQRIAAIRKQNPAAAREADKNNSLEKFVSGNKKFAKDMEELQQYAHQGYRDFLNPAATFLSGVGLLRDGVFDNARIEFQRLCDSAPGNQLFRRYLATILPLANRPVPADLQSAEPFDFPLDRDCVYLFFNNGRGASLKQVALYIPIATAWAVCEFYQAPFSHLTVNAGNAAYRSYQLANMDAVFAAEFNERLPLTVTRIVLSTAVKEGAKYTATAVAGGYDPLLGAVVFAGASAYNAMLNTADTRSWEILPKEIQLTQFPMPEDRRISLTLHGGKNVSQTLEIPRDCRSAIIVVSAFSQNNISIHVLPLKKQ